MKRMGIVTALCLAVLAAGPAMAAKDYNWKVLAAISYVSPLSDTTDSAGDVFEAKSEAGWEIGGEWRATGLIGLELDYLSVTHDIESDGQKLAELDMNPLSLSANFHLIQGKVIDFWVGPTVSYIDFGDVDGQSVDGETTFGAVAGVDIGFGKSFAITGGLRWLDATAEGDGGEELSIDPVFLRAGVAFRF